MTAAVPGWRVLPLTAALSLAAHAGVVGAFMPSETGIAQEGGGAVVLAALGNSFADFTQGAAPVSPAVAPPVTATSPAATPAPSAAIPTALPRAEPSTPAAPAHPIPERASPVPVTAAPESEPTRPPVTDEPPVVVRVADSETPHPRPRPQPVGDSPQSARRGTSEGSTGASAAPSTPTRTAPAPGNAAASSYPGEVLRRIQSTRRARVTARGLAVVAFTLSGSGALDSARIVRSSGSPELDGAALDHIRRAAPFPAPPAGAQRQFTFEFAGR